jgi:uncharacterized membrane protein
VSGKSADVFSCLREGWHYFWRVYASAILFIVLFAGGLMLFILPGIYVLQRYLLAPFYVVDRDLGIREAFKTSARESAPFSAYIWGLLGVLLAITFISSAFASLPVIGSLVSLAITYTYFFGPALRYKSISTAATGLPAAKK